MSRYIRLTDSDIANAVRKGTSSSRSATIARAGLEMLVRDAGSSRIALEHVERAVDSLTDYFLSESETRGIMRYLEDLYDEQQGAAAA